jgi:endoglucanase
MIRILCLLSFLAFPCWAQPPPERLAMLRYGVNITGWFRYPGSRDPAHLVRWMSDAAMADVRRAGFGFVRLAIDPPVAEAPGMRDIVVEAVCRLQRHGLAVVVDAHPTGWHLETSAADRASLRGFWRGMSAALRRCDPGLTIPEVLNEPVFPGDPGGWATLQHAVLGDIRTGLPDSTVVLTGHDWGSIDGLLALSPESDRNTVYSFHFYEPTDLTSLASYRPNLDRQALARLPFPVGDRAACEAMASGDPATAGLMRYHCAMGWDRAAIAGRIDAAAAWARNHRVPLLAGEFGATVALNPAARLAWIGTVRQSLEAAGIGWALWGYDDIMGFAVQRPPVARPLLDGNVLRALGLPRAR